MLAPESTNHKYGSWSSVDWRIKFGMGMRTSTNGHLPQHQVQTKSHFQPQTPAVVKILWPSSPWVYLLNPSHLSLLSYLSPSPFPFLLLWIPCRRTLFLLSASSDNRRRDGLAHCSGSRCVSLILINFPLPVLA